MNKMNIAKKRLLSLILIWGLVSGGLIVLTNLPLNQKVSASPDPPVIDGGTTEFNGDWYVDAADNLVYKNQTIILNGDLTINNTGTLTFYNVTLKMNCTFDGEYCIEMKNSGTFHIYDYDNNNITIEDASVIRNGTTHHHYLIKVRNGSNFIMKNSELYECGWNDDNQGLIIESDNVIIENNIILNNRYGIFISSSNNHIINCTILKNYIGIYLKDSSNNNIINNNVSNNWYGIYLDSANENNIIYCTVSHNKWSGIRLSSSLKNNISNTNASFNNIIFIYHAGIYLYTSSNNNSIKNCVLSSNNMFGIRSSYSFNNTIINCNISSTNGDGINLYYRNKNSLIEDCYISQSNKNGINLTNFNINNTIKNCKISLNNKNGIFIQKWTDSTTIINCNISDNNKGIYFSRSLNNEIKSNYIQANIEGLYFHDNSNANVHLNKIYNNANYGIRNIDSYTQVNATYNWWGHSSGPYHLTINPNGKGDNVSNYVLFKPWLNSPDGNVFPKINTKDQLTAIEDAYYEIIYNATDLNNDPITWEQSSNAKWLNWDDMNHTLWGTPTNEDVGNYWVCINVTDGRNGYYEHNFTLKVENVPPIILTEDITVATEDLEYRNDYNSNDDNQGMIMWTLYTDAIWLSLNSNTGVLNGIPQNEDVDSYWVRINVSDGNGGYDENYFILTVVNVNDAPTISGAPTTLEINAYENKILNFSIYIDDVDNETSELFLLVDSEYAKINKFNITFNYPNSISSENVKITVSDGIDKSLPHFILITVIPKDIDLPTITNKNPTGSNVPINSNITVTFSEPMLHSNVESAFSISPSVKGVFSWNNNIMIFNLDSNLMYNTTYTITINTTATDIAGNPLEELYSWNFTTEIEIMDIIDTDGDGTPDIEDDDDDNDGFLDLWEEFLGTDPNDPNDKPVDTDGDGKPDGDSTNSQPWMDTDDDDDGFNDLIDEYPLDSSKHKKEEDNGPNGEKPNNSEEDNTMLYASIIIIVIIIIVVLILLFLFLKKKKPQEKEQVAEEPQPHEPPQVIQPSPQHLEPPAPKVMPQVPQIEQPSPVIPTPQPLGIQSPTTPQVIPTVTPPPVVKQPTIEEELEE